MKLIHLSGKYGIDKFAIVDDEDYEWLNQWKWFAIKHRNTYYAIRNSRIGEREKRTIIRMHRFILGLTDPEILGDHINRDGLDNQRNNLRKCTNAENVKNTKSRKNSTSKYLGVSINNRNYKWLSQINFNKKGVFLGYFENEIDAALAYNEAAIKYHGEFANLNVL